MKIRPVRAGVFLGLLGWAVVLGHAQAGPWNQWGQDWAAAFSDWSLNSLTSVPSPGTYSLHIDTANPPVIAGGPSIQPLDTRAPLLVGSGADQEIATPSAVSCSWSPGNCTITITLQHAHRAPFPVRSGTGGLQEAVDYSLSHGGGNVGLGPPWSGSTAQIAAVQGGAGVIIEDNRAGHHGWWVWNGSQYTLQWSLAGDPATPAAIETAQFNGIFNSQQFPGVDMNGHRPVVEPERRCRVLILAPHCCTPALFRSLPEPSPWPPGSRAGRPA